MRQRLSLIVSLCIGLPGCTNDYGQFRFSDVDDASTPSVPQNAGDAATAMNTPPGPAPVPPDAGSFPDPMAEPASEGDAGSTTEADAGTTGDAGNAD